VLEGIAADDRESLAWMRSMENRSDEPAAPMPDERVHPALDALRAAEVAGVEIVGAWIAVCRRPALRGTLRALAMREAAHAAALEERLRALGGAPVAVVPEAVRAAALADFGGPAIPDDEKVAVVVARLDGEAERRLSTLADLLDDDPETRELVRLVAVGEAISARALAAHRGAGTAL
jgi:hypothetical protein